MKLEDTERSDALKNAQDLYEGQLDWLSDIESMSVSEWLWGSRVRVPSFRERLQLLWQYYVTGGEDLCPSKECVLRARELLKFFFRAFPGITTTMDVSPQGEIMLKLSWKEIDGFDLLIVCNIPRKSSVLGINTFIKGHCNTCTVSFSRAHMFVRNTAYALCRPISKEAWNDHS